MVKDNTGISTSPNPIPGSATLMGNRDHSDGCALNSKNQCVWEALGPVTIQSTFSDEPVRDKITSNQITKNVSGEGYGTKRGSDTMGMKCRIDQGVYVFYGSMNPQLADRTEFSEKDAEAVKQVLPKLFENDASPA